MSFTDQAGPKILIRTAICSHCGCSGWFSNVDCVKVSAFWAQQNFVKYVLCIFNPETMSLMQQNMPEPLALFKRASKESSLDFQYEIGKMTPSRLGYIDFFA